MFQYGIEESTLDTYCPLVKIGMLFGIDTVLYCVILYYVTLYYIIIDKMAYLVSTDTLAIPSCLN